MNYRLYKIPKDLIPEIKTAYENGEWFWLVNQWNKYEVGTERLCATCPKSCKIIRENMNKLWEDEQ